jgi:hypothetical protein
LSKQIRGRVWGSHFTSVKLLVETSETCTKKKIKSTPHNTRDQNRKTTSGLDLITTKIARIYVKTAKSMRLKNSLGESRDRRRPCWLLGV